MGIQGLLPFLSPIQRPGHLRDFAGKTIGVDGYVWLHRGAYACATELVTGQPTTKYVEFAMQRVRLMRHNGVEPYVVFDGGPLPAKRGTEEKRRRAREESQREARSLAAAGKHTQARELYTKCVDVTPQMAFQVIKALRAENVAFVVAPYEADAQLIYLERCGLVDGILTEDSDLLVFGAKLFLAKLDGAGNLMSVRREDFGAPELAMHGWADREFREMAMLAGCDYLDSIPGMGVKTAHKMMRKYRSAEKVVKIVRYEGKLRPVPRGYEQNFRVAELAFLYQRVYDPLSECLVHLDDPPHGVLDANGERFVGGEIPPDEARQIARGEMCPIGRIAMVDINVAFRPAAVAPTSAEQGVLVPRDGNVQRTPAPARGKSGLPASGRKSAGPLDRFFGAKPSLTRPTSAPQLRSSSSHHPLIADSPTPVRAAVFVDPRARGKRTLVDLMNEDQERTRARCASAQEATSSLFAATLSRVVDEDQLSDVDDNGDRLAKRPRVEEIVLDPVEQEEGYASPDEGALDVSSPGGADDDVELSSPVRPTAHEGDILSSPPARRRPVSVSKARGRRVLRPDAVRSDPKDGSVDLAPLFIAALDSDASEEQDDEAVTPDQTQRAPAVRLGAGMDAEIQLREMQLDIEEDDDWENQRAQEKQRMRVVAQGWRAKYSFSQPAPKRANKENVVPVHVPAPSARNDEFESEEPIEDDFSSPPPPAPKPRTSLLQRFRFSAA